MNKAETAYWLKCEGHTNSYIADVLGIPRNNVPTLAKKHLNKNKKLRHWDEVSGKAYGKASERKQEGSKSDVRYETAYWLKCEGYTNAYIADVIGTTKNVVPTFAKKYMERNSLPRWNATKKQERDDKQGVRTRRPRPEKAKTYTKDAANAQINDRIQMLAERVIDPANPCRDRDMNQLMVQLMPKLRFYIWGYMKVEADTDDVLNNTLEKICLNMHTYNPAYRFTTWAYNIAKNESLTWLQKLPRGHVDIEDYTTYLENTMIDDSAEVLEKEIQRDGVLTDVYAAIHSVSFDDGNLMLLEKDINRRKCKDIADMYSMNTNTVKTKIRAGRRRVHERVMLGHSELTTKLVIFEL